MDIRFPLRQWPHVCARYGGKDWPQINRGRTCQSDSLRSTKCGVPAFRARSNCSLICNSVCRDFSRLSVGSKRWLGRTEFRTLVIRSEPRLGTRKIIHESEMVLFSECSSQCARRQLDTADIVRDGDLSTARVVALASHPSVRTVTDAGSTEGEHWRGRYSL